MGASVDCTEQTPSMSAPAYGVIPMLVPLSACTDMRGTAPFRLNFLPPKPVVAVAIPVAKLALPRNTSEPSRSSTACQPISVMSSCWPPIARSMRIVVASISRARSIRAPMSSPRPFVWYPTSTNVELMLTAIGSVTSTESAAFPASDVLPFCTRMSAAVVNSITCQSMRTLTPSMSMRICRLVVVVSSATIGSSPLRLFWSVAAGVFDHVTKA